MALFGKKKALEEKVAYLEENASTEFKAVQKMKAEIEKLEAELCSITARKNEEQKKLSDFLEEKRALELCVKNLQEQVVTLEDEVLMQEFGIYQPRYAFMTVDAYKDKLKELREKQKQIARELNDDAKNTAWTVNGSKSEGKKMITSEQKLLLRAFNSEADETITKVKFSNIEASVKSIKKSAETISKLGAAHGLDIPNAYTNLKVEEAYVSYEYAKFKEEEKERLRELKAQEKEAKKLEKEIEAERKKLEKEQQQYTKALKDVLAQLESASEEERDALEAKKAELEENLGEVAKAFEDVDYREANQKAGYVYIISNIGSFGEDVYKIGMTRRLDPMERIKELGDASVPFDFDIHALIFSNDAPGLEAALHREFEARKLNLVNHRREFFKCSLEEIKTAVLKNYDQTVEFVSIPDAEQFRISEKMRQEQ